MKKESKLCSENFLNMWLRVWPEWLVYRSIFWQILFLFCAFRCEWSDGSESDPAGLRRAVCDRSNGRDRFSDKIPYYKIKGWKCGLLFRTVSDVEYSVQHSVYTVRNLISGKYSENTRCRCKSCETWNGLSSNRSARVAVFYVKPYVHGIYQKRWRTVKGHAGIDYRKPV